MNLYLFCFPLTATSVPTSTPDLHQDKVDFLGLELSSYDAKVPFYVIFACLLVIFLGRIVAAYEC